MHVKLTCLDGARRAGLITRKRPIGVYQEAMYWPNWRVYGQIWMTGKSFSACQIPINSDIRATLLSFTALKKLREEEKWQFALF